MYEQFYGLREAPFELTPNPKFLFLSPAHREALSNLTYAVKARKGITLLVGEPGTGKTTIIHALLATNREGGTHRFLNLENPTLTRGEFYRLLAARLGLGGDSGTSKAHFLLDLERSVRDGYASGARTVLIFDEAQALSHELLEEVRLLSNIETDTEKLLPIILAGQPEIGERLEMPEFEALKQRTTLRCELAPFGLVDTAAYIGARLRIAGGEPSRIFTRDAVALIHEASGGVPRTISVICDNALVGGFAASLKPVGADIVREVCRDFKLSHDGRRAQGAGRHAAAGAQPAVGLQPAAGVPSAVRVKPAAPREERTPPPEDAPQDAPSRRRAQVLSRLADLVPGRKRQGSTLGLNDDESDDDSDAARKRTLRF